MLTKVFRPKITGCPMVISLNRFRSDGMDQGILFSKPMTRFSDMAAISEMIMRLH